MYACHALGCTCKQSSEGACSGLQCLTPSFHHRRDVSPQAFAPCIETQPAATASVWKWVLLHGFLITGKKCVIKSERTSKRMSNSLVA